MKLAVRLTPKAQQQLIRASQKTLAAAIIDDNNPLASVSISLEKTKELNNSQNK